MADKNLPLADLTVIDISTLFAGPFAAQILGDFGATVIKVEQSAGDPLRRFGRTYEDIPLWWKVLNRNKKGIILDLNTPDGAEKFLRLAATADVVIENFRPGTLERWGLGPARLTEINPDLIMTRVTAFGQDGPYSQRPGFGTLAEAMSGLAAISGELGGPPLLPAFQLGDAIAGVYAVCATLIALHARGRVGHGQIADVAITEAVISLLGAQFSIYEKLGVKQERLGNRSPNSAPRNVYRCKDGSWVAVSAPAQSVAERVLRLVGRPDLVDQPWFRSGAGRAEHRDEIDEAVGGWISARERDDVIAEFEHAEAAVGPIYEVDDILRDPHFQARNVVVSVPDAEMGAISMPNVAFRLSATPGRIRQAGPQLGEHTEEIMRVTEENASGPTARSDEE